jgi:hypothetical protein
MRLLRKNIFGSYVGKQGVKILILRIKQCISEDKRHSESIHTIKIILQVKYQQKNQFFKREQDINAYYITIKPLLYKFM